MTTRTEIGEGPDVVARLIEEGSGPVEAIAKAVRSRGIDLVMVAARGTSDHAAIYAQYILGARNGLPVALATPSLASVYGTTPQLHNALVLGISQSGQSPDIVAVLDDARRQGALTVAITNDPASALAAAAEFTVPINAGPELGVAATKTYLASIAVIAMLSGALTADRESRMELSALPEAIRVALDTEERVVSLAASRAGDDRCVVLARGFQYATARELALKVKELAYVLADPYSAADFQHGPIALVTAGFPVISIATAGPALPGVKELMARLRAGKARLLVISDDAEALAMGDGIALPVGVPEWLSPLVAIVPGQLYAYHLAEARGSDPDRPRNLSKVTLTR
jgi:glutamine---fructose-6-phosphate transaminase (isomerizing)